MIAAGRFGILPDTIHVDMDRHFVFFNPTNGRAMPLLEPVVMGVPFAKAEPKVFDCYRGEPTRMQKTYWFRGVPPCDYVEEELADDPLMLLTPELLDIAKQIMPCNQDLAPEH